MDADRFLDAQAPVWEDVRAELSEGRKRTHWMWFVFPQLKGLGRSSTAEFYGLDGPGDAAAFLAHPVLGRRLTEAMGLMLTHSGKPVETILGPVDALKLRSSATLFTRVPDAPGVIEGVLAAFFDGPCERTRAMLGGAQDPREGAAGRTPPDPSRP